MSVSPRTVRFAAPKPGEFECGAAAEGAVSPPGGGSSFPVEARVARRFGGVWYSGRVVACLEPSEDDPDRRRWYRVEYEDGDGEDLTRKEVTTAIDAHADHVKLEAARRDATPLPPFRRPGSGAGAPDRDHNDYYDKIEIAVDARSLEQLEMSRTARLLLALRPRNSPPCKDHGKKRKRGPDGRPSSRPSPPPPPKVAAPSRFRKNHQAQSKPPVDDDGNYPCAKGCGRVFTHAPAAVAHTKACRFCPSC